MCNLRAISFKTQIETYRISEKKGTKLIRESLADGFGYEIVIVIIDLCFPDSLINGNNASVITCGSMKSRKHNLAGILTVSIATILQAYAVPEKKRRE